MVHDDQCWRYHLDCANEEIRRCHRIINRISLIDAEEEATGSRDFGRGFSLALTRFKEIIEEEK